MLLPKTGYDFHAFHLTYGQYRMHGLRYVQSRWSYADTGKPVLSVPYSSLFLWAEPDIHPDGFHTYRSSPLFSGLCQTCPADSHLKGSWHDLRFCGPSLPYRSWHGDTVRSPMPGNSKDVPPEDRNLPRLPALRHCLSPASTPVFRSYW